MAGLPIIGYSVNYLKKNNKKKLTSTKRTRLLKKTTKKKETESEKQVSYTLMAPKKQPKHKFLFKKRGYVLLDEASQKNPSYIYCI